MVSTPDKEPGPECRNLPRGSTPPPACRPANLHGDTYWKVTIETNGKHYVVRPYRAPKILEAINQERPAYIDPKLAAGDSVEVAVYPKSLRIRKDQGDG